MFMSQDFAALQTAFAPMPMTEVQDIAKPAPTHGPFDWTSDIYSADSFVFRANMADAAPHHA